MRADAMELQEWGVAALGEEAGTVLGGVDPIDVAVGAVIVYLVTHLAEFANGLRDGFNDAQ